MKKETKHTMQECMTDIQMIIRALCHAYEPRSDGSLPRENHYHKLQGLLSLTNEIYENYNTNEEEMTDDELQAMFTEAQEGRSLLNCCKCGSKAAYAIANLSGAPIVIAHCTGCGYR